MKTNHYNGIDLGPLLNEDALLLQALIKMTTPRIVVEFGYLWGDSSTAMLEVMSPDAMLHSFDNSKNPIIEDSRFCFHRKSQEEIDGIENIDFVFLDASHEFELDKLTFLRIKECLSEKAIIAVHDTGTWVGGNVFNAEVGEMNALGQWVHRPDEVRFVDWIKKEYPEFQQIHLHSSRELRHGMTLLQRYKKLT